MLALIVVFLLCQPVGAGDGEKCIVQDCVLLEHRTNSYPPVPKLEGYRVEPTARRNQLSSSVYICVSKEVDMSQCRDMLQNPLRLSQNYHMTGRYLSDQFRDSNKVAKCDGFNQFGVCLESDCNCKMK